MGLFDSITGKLFGDNAGQAADFLKKIASGQQTLQGESWNQTKSALSQIDAAMRGYMTGEKGFDPEQLALLKSAFLNKAAKGYGDANRNVKTAMLRSGSAAGPMGGDAIRPIATLEGGQADTVSSGLMGIDISNLEQALENQFRAAGVLGHSADTMTNWGNNFTSGMGAAMKSYSDVMPYTSGTQFGGKFGSSLGEALGKMAGGGLAKVAKGTGGK